MVVNHISFEIYKNNYIVIYARKGEVNARTIIATLKDENCDTVSLSGKSVTFYALKPDGTKIYNTCTVNTTNNTVEVLLTSQAVSVAGMVECEFQVFEGDTLLLKLGGLKIAVDDCEDFSSSVESSSEYNTLIHAINEAESFSESVGDISDLTTTDKTSVVNAVNELNGKTIPISNGGTSATTATTARTNLEVMKEYSLYSNSSGTNGTITISDSYTNYSIIKILFADNGVYNVFSFYTDVAYRTPLSTIYAYSGVNGIYFHGCLLAFSGKSVTFSRQSIGNFTSSGTSVSSDTVLKVYKILGYKY